MKRKLLQLLTTVGMTLVVTLGFITTASADTKTVTISISDGWCVQNGRYSGSVSKVLIDAIPSNSGQPGWQNGRSRSGISVIYSPSGSSVRVPAVIFCKTAWYGAGYYRELTFGRWVDRNTSTYWPF